MKQIKQKVLFILLCIFSSITIYAQINASAKLSKTNILIGDQVQLSLSVNITDGVEIEQVNWTVLDTLSKVEVLNIHEARIINHNNGRLLEQQVILTSFDEGHYVIPAIQIVYSFQGNQQQILTNDLALTVETIPLGEEELLEVEPIKDIFKTGYMPSWWVIALALLTPLVVLGIVMLIKKLSNKEQKEQVVVLPPPPPAHELALIKLNALENKQLWQSGNIKAFQSELTYIFREYLENKFAIQALENTSDEIITSIKEVAIEQSKIDQIRHILETADLVKFAKSEPPIEVHAKAFNEIKAFVKATQAFYIQRPDSTTPIDINND